MEYYDKKIKIDFEIPDYIRENIKKLIEERKNNTLHIDLEESDLLANINRAYYNGELTKAQAELLRKKYL